MLNIYYGRETLDKGKFIFSNIGEKALVMVPDQYTLEAEKEAFKYLGTNSLMDVEIVSPSSIGDNVLKELGGSKRNFINKYGRHMLLYKSAMRQRENLQVFRGMETKTSFLDSVNDFISEMKQYNCTAEDLRLMAQSPTLDSYTCRKLTDIYLLFKDYEESIVGKYTDSEDYIDLFLDKIQDFSDVKGNNIWIYGFDSFSPKTMKLIGKLMLAANDVNLVLTWDNGGRDSDLFELTGIVMKNAEATAEAMGVPHKRYKIPDEFRRNDRRKAISHIETEIYTMPSATCDDIEGISLIEAAGVYNEAESAAAYVLELVREKGLRYKDIRLICNDVGKRTAIIERVFDEYGIEVFSDSKRDIMNSPTIQFITALIDIIINKYSTEAMFRMLKAGFSDLTTDELSELENYTIKYKIKGGMWKKPFRRGKAEYGDEGLAVVEDIRKRAVTDILPLENVFKSETVGEFLRGFYAYLNDCLKLREKILEFVGEQEEKELFDLADETARIWQSLSDILTQIDEIMGNEIFEAEAFRNILLAGLSQVEIGLLPPTEDGLILGNMQRSRSGRVKATVIMGVNEGILPQEKPTQGLFSTEERELFREDGKELCKVDSIRYMEERLAIYRNLTAPTDFLWMSYSVSDEDGNQLRPSSIALKIKELFPSLPLQRDVINRDDSICLINSKISGLRNLSRELEDISEGEEASQEWKEALSWLEHNKPEEISSILNSINFTNRHEDLGRAAAEALFKRDTTKALSLSPSRLERFSRCPFSHLVAYGLKPEERRIFEAAPREIGDIYHQCLMKLTQELTKEGVEITSPESPWMTVTKEQCYKMVEDEIIRIADEYREGLLKASALESYRGERLTAICSQVCWIAVEQVRAGKILQIAAETKFGRKGNIPPIELDVDGEKVYIEGIIDRIDYLDDDRIKIIDYKTGSESFSVAEAEAGYRLQLMIYLKAACGENKKPAGVFYFRIQEPMVDFSQREIDRETLEKEIRKSFKLDGIMVDNSQIIQDIAGDFEGYSEIVPIQKTKEGVKGSGKEGLLEETAFSELQDAVNEKIKEACGDLLAGKIEANPMKTKTRSACTFCQYRGICRFDTVFEGCKYKVID